MATVVMDHDFAERLRQERAAAGADRWDEVWEGTYMMAPAPNNEHQEIGTRLCVAFVEVAGWDSGAVVTQVANVSDRDRRWKQNYRCPDIVVYLANTKAKNLRTHWNGGPDLAVEITSDDDQTRDKIPFYAKVGTRELLIVDRNPWSLELFRLTRKKLKSVGVSSGRKGQVLESRVLPLTFQLKSGKSRPTIDVVRTTDGQKWSV